MTTPPGGTQGNGPGSGRFWLADILWQVGAIQFGDFSLGRTARHSPVYVNPKLIIARPDALARVATLIEEELRTAMVRRNHPAAPFEQIAGVPIGGLHIATALALQMGQPLLYVRPGELEEGERAHIEGIYRPGQTAMLVDDLATGGGSLIETAGRLRRAGLFVKDAIVLIDREQGASRRLKEVGVHLHAIVTMEMLLTFLHSIDRVVDEDYRRAMLYLGREGEARSEFD